ncbi:Hypothetical predicted protein [Prunus dulcis]|uniref:Uncharacterized protein n=1 Tax=Prunus dulcis TaxID=3755 RepID=A0A5E4GAD1_PRUDU|nr:Hypothetical predicted protein [Prunus dulcis]
MRYVGVKLWDEVWGSESSELIDKCLLDGGLLRLMKCHGLEGVLNGGDVGVEAMLLFGHQRQRIMLAIELGDNLFFLQSKLQISVRKFRHRGEGRSFALAHGKTALGARYQFLGPENKKEETTEKSKL